MRREIFQYSPVLERAFSVVKDKRCIALLLVTLVTSCGVNNSAKTDPVETDKKGEGVSQKESEPGKAVYAECQSKLEEYRKAKENLEHTEQSKVEVEKYHYACKLKPIETIIVLDGLIKIITGKNDQLSDYTMKMIKKVEHIERMDTWEKEKTLCEQAYVGTRDTMMALIGLGPDQINVEAKANYVEICENLSEEEQRCVNTAYAINNAKECALVTIRIPRETRDALARVFSIQQAGQPPQNTSDRSEPPE